MISQESWLKILDVLDNLMNHIFYKKCLLDCGPVYTSLKTASKVGCVLHRKRIDEPLDD